MSFSYRVDPDGLRLVVSSGPDAVATFDFAVPSDADESTEWRTSIDHREDGDGWLTSVRLDNLSSQTCALPPVGVGITVGDGWAGWSWASDVQGIVLLAPTSGDGRVLVARVRGFCRVAASLPVFAPAARQVDPALPVAYGVLHLANPTGSVAGFGRAASVLEFDSLGSLADAGGLLPDWLPELVVGEGEEVVFDTPDWAVVPGINASLTRDDTSMVLTSGAGHREVAIHATQGIHRLRATFAPGLGDLLADVAEPLIGRRPSALGSASAVVVAGALLFSDAEADRALDWLEREDWLARGDLFGCAVAVLLAGHTGDAVLARDAWQRLVDLQPVRGRPLLGMSAWLAYVALTGGAPGAAALPGGLDGLGLLETAVLKNHRSDAASSALAGVVNRLGADLPGQPLLLPEAEAGYLIALLHLVPETWPERDLATATAVKASALLLADHADGLQPGLDGLAWLTLANLAL